MKASTDFVLPSMKVPSWVNRMMRLGLKTPGLQSLLGRHVALITLTGRRSQRRITTPVTFHRDGDTVLVVTKRASTWWRNIETNPELTLRIAGKTLLGKAEAITHDDAKLPLVTEFLRHRPRDAKAYGVKLGPQNDLDAETGRALVPHLIPIVVRLD